MSLMSRKEAIISLTPAADYTGKRGYLVGHDGTTATVSSSATVRAKGIILEGNRTAAGYATEKVTVGLLGALAGTCPVKLGGTVASGDFVQQHTDGTVITDAGTGARVIVGQVLEAGVANDLVEMAPCTPHYYAA